MTYIIMGPQGSGKGTQAKLLAKELGIEHVSIGDVLRKEVALGSERGNIIHDYMKKGELIPLQLNNQIVEEILNKDREIILDGYPRNLDQAKYLLSHSKITALIVVKISEEESVIRLSKRLICTANNKIFIEDKITQQDRDECSKLGGQIIKREDDEPEAIKKRLQIYCDETKPIIHLFKENNIQVLEINGEKPIEQVFEEIKNKLLEKT